MATRPLAITYQKIIIFYSDRCQHLPFPSQDRAIFFQTLITNMSSCHPSRVQLPSKTSFMYMTVTTITQQPYKK